MTRLSVIVPTLNEERYIGSLLSDIARQTRAAEEVIVVDAGSGDATTEVASGFEGVRLLSGSPPVARGRNLGGRNASGDVLLFLDADVRLPPTFFEGFVEEFERRRLDVACPEYVPYDSTPAVSRFHDVFNSLIKASEGFLPSGAGSCLAVRGGTFHRSRGFDPDLKFDDIELIRRLSRGNRFGIVGERVLLSDRRYRENGAARMFLTYALMGLFFVLGKFHWANYLDYEFGAHG